VQARPIYHHKRGSIDAHLTVVFAALAVTYLIEKQSGCSIRASLALLAATGPSTSARAGMS